MAETQDYVSAAPLAFARVCFGSLMIIYSASKCTDVAPYSSVGASLLAPIEYNVPDFLRYMLESHPWYTHNSLYWKVHPCLMLLSATGIALGFGPLSKMSCLAFGWLKLVTTMQSQHMYNNHEFLYAIFALLLGLLSGHDAQYSFLGQAARESISLEAEAEAEAEVDGVSSLSHESERNGSTKQSPRSSTPLTFGPMEKPISNWFCLGLFSLGCITAAALNAVHGIAGVIAPLCMILSVWPATALMLGQSCLEAEKRFSDDDAVAETVETAETLKPGARLEFTNNEPKPINASLSSKRNSKAKANAKAKTNTLTSLKTTAIKTSTSTRTRARARARGLVPVWQLWSLRALLGSMYFFAGTAKLSTDWLHGFTASQLLHSWASPSAPWPLKQALATLSTPTILSQRAAAGAAAFDLLLPFLLCLPLGMLVGNENGDIISGRRRPPPLCGSIILWLRRFATAAAVCFHLVTHFAFVIETFPWVAMSCLSAFHGPGWLRGVAVAARRSVWWLLSCTGSSSSSSSSSSSRSRSSSSRSAPHCLSLSLPFSRCGSGTLRTLFSATTSAAALLLLLVVLTLPLPCALYAASSDSLTFTASCQLFSWWMMTRAVRLRSSELVVVTTTVTSNGPTLASAAGAAGADGGGVAKESVLESVSVEKFPASLAAVGSLYLDASLLRSLMQRADPAQSSDTAQDHYAADPAAMEELAAAEQFVRSSTTNEHRLQSLATALCKSQSLFWRRSNNGGSSSSPVLQVRVQVQAEVWLEVNGPPAQRFAQPNADLAVTAHTFQDQDQDQDQEQHLDEAEYNCFDSAVADSGPGRDTSQPLLAAALKSFVTALWYGPQSIRRPWLMHRISQFRSSAWARRYAVLERAATARGKRVFFFADQLLVPDGLMDNEGELEGTEGAEGAEGAKKIIKKQPRVVPLPTSTTLTMGFVAPPPPCGLGPPQSVVAGATATLRCCSCSAARRTSFTLAF